ncbi:FecR family protein [Azospirillum sp. RWY-5-1]|uniref:FecR family protein n=1 Tax=Azospirillum oleiclasticum TaxID=2735135 RepID=A0ABX2TJ92_9PROT|nr:FecR family protein [Azospirillum oleiclasticum]NYZ14550.1 FecR family protein [Azospirillum oleiclasticum]NYZ24328.1 FecR family protein [Azospirillum oleiclasticum]
MDQHSDDGYRQGGSGQGDAFRHSDPITDAALDWYVTLQSGVVDAETLSAFQAWRSCDQRHATAYDRLAGIDRMPELRMATLEHAAATAIPSAPRRSTPRPRVRMRIASLMTATVLLAIGLHLYPELGLALNADVRTSAGERRQVTLPDGSRMMLNTASAAAFDFGGDRRSVRLLAGEAYFEVVPDAARPFTVAAGHSTVRVTGTAFAVRTGDAEDSIVLEHGRIVVDRPGGSDPALELIPGDRVTASARGLSAIVRAEPATLLAWRDGRYIFHEQPFSAVVDDLRRYYGGIVLSLGHRSDQERVSGNYRLDDPVAALKAVAGIAGVPMTVLPGGFIIIG